MINAERCPFRGNYLLFLDIPQLLNARRKETAGIQMNEILSLRLKRSAARQAP
jgi:hypothetical protein